MPPAKTTWQTVPTPQTPLQRGQFMDLCVSSLVDADDAAPPLSLFTVRTASTTTSAASRFEMTRAELRLLTTRACGFCDSTDGARPVLANPFAGKPLVLACDRCHGMA